MAAPMGRNPGPLKAVECTSRCGWRRVTLHRVELAAMPRCQGSAGPRADVDTPRDSPYTPAIPTPRFRPEVQGSERLKWS